MPKARIAERLGISRTTVVKTVKPYASRRYVRGPAPSSFTVFELAARTLLEEVPDMPATVLAERVGWTGSIRWFRENGKRLRPSIGRSIRPTDSQLQLLELHRQLEERNDELAAGRAAKS